MCTLYRRGVRLARSENAPEGFESEGKLSSIAGETGRGKFNFCKLVGA